MGISQETTPPEGAITVPRPSFDALTDRCVQILCDLLRFDTTNPPGNELPAVRYIEDLLRQAGVAAEVFEAAPGRGNLVARIPASAPAPAGTDASPLLLMGHVDVVPADPSEWSVDPFGGVVRDGYVWGRGALDMKNTVAQFLTLVLELARRRVPLHRDIIFMVNADEEAGGTFGARYMVERHWDRIACGAALNEGGGDAEEMGGRTVYTYQTSEKAGIRFTLRARGRPGHGSIPHNDNAVVHLARALAAIGAARMPVHVTPTVRAYLEGIAGEREDGLAAVLRGLLDPARAHDVLDSPEAQRYLTPFQRAALRALLTNSLSPTILRGGTKVNVIPASAEAVIDTRVLPGQSLASVRREVEEVLARAGVLEHVELLMEPGVAEPSESPPDHPLAESIRRALERHAPGAVLVPAMLTGGTDARFLRPRGVVVYGFSPLLPGEDLIRVHGIDERISLASLRFGLEVLWDVIMDYCASGGT